MECCRRSPGARLQPIVTVAKTAWICSSCTHYKQQFGFWLLRRRGSLVRANDGTQQDPGPEHGVDERKALRSRIKPAEDGMPAHAPQMEAKAYREVCD